ncbi:MAG: YfiR family protein [Acidobacteriales bacterium]|nr:YfiR family protein [Terriglobales bacterium]
MTVRPGHARSRTETRLRLLATAVCVVVLTLSVPRAPSQIQDERTVKAAFVFNLTKYVEWPEPAARLTVGVVGTGPMSDALQKILNGKISDGRPIIVLLLHSEDQVQQCHIVFVATAAHPLRPMLDRIRDRPVLTVSDTDGFAQHGGMVGLVRQGDQIQLQVNLQAAQEAHLRISSRLLSLSTIVRSSGGEQ